MIIHTLRITVYKCKQRG